MTRDRKDRSANWIIERHGGSLLRLANITNFVSWHAASSVLSFPKQVPDGLLEVTFPDRAAADPFLIEIEAFPQSDTLIQLRDDAAMVLLTRGVLPDILLLILAPKGTLDIAPEQVIQSAHGLTDMRLRIRVVKLWTIAAEELLAAHDVGLIPWVPLAKYSGSPETLLRMCRDRIDEQAPPQEKANLLATTHAMAEMRYNDLDLATLFGGHAMTMEKVLNMSPFIQRLKAQTARETSSDLILRWLTKRFGSVPEVVAVPLRGITDQTKLDWLVDVAYECPDLDQFREAMGAP